MLFTRRPRQPLRVMGQFVTTVCDLATRARRAARGYATVGQFAAFGRNFSFDPDGTYTYGSISVGDDVNLGTRPMILATRSAVRIGNNVMFGPRVTIRGGNHRFDIIGKTVDAVTDEMKRPEDDLGVTIEDDVWVGGNATILHGVTIGRGSIIGGSAVVTKSVPPYSIVVGNPARVVRARFGAEDIIEHEKILHPKSRTTSTYQAAVAGGNHAS